MHDFEIPLSVIESEQKAKPEAKLEDIKNKIKLDLILEAIAKKEDIKVNEKDINHRISTMAQMYKRNVEEVRKLYLGNRQAFSQLVFSLLLDKTVALLVSNLTGEKIEATLDSTEHVYKPEADHHEHGPDCQHG